MGEKTRSFWLQIPQRKPSQSATRATRAQHTPSRPPTAISWLFGDTESAFNGPLKSIDARTLRPIVSIFVSAMNFLHILLLSNHIIFFTLYNWLIIIDSLWEEAIDKMRENFDIRLPSSRHILAPSLRSCAATYDVQDKFTCAIKRAIKKAFMFTAARVNRWRYFEMKRE